MLATDPGSAWVPRPPRRRGRVLRNVAITVTVLALTGVVIGWLDKQTPVVSDGVRFPQSAVDADQVTQALEQLSALPIEAENNAAYDRDSYGARWSDVESNGCNQRDDRLFMDAIRGTVVAAEQGACEHDVLAGHWIDPYTADLMVATDLKDETQAMSITIDHVVPLAEAHGSGAANWPAERRLLFANDLPGLRVVAGSVNSSKSDQDPAQWLPNAGAVCWYAALWIGIKTAWSLAMDQAEHTALQRVLDSCSKS